MKQILKHVARKITAALNRLGEDFDMLLMDDILPYPLERSDFDTFDDELLV